MPIKYEHLIGMPFDQDRRNCYQLMRDLYRDNWDIELTNYACPTDWWNDKRFDLFGNLAEHEGFDVITSHPRHWLPGDVIIMAIGGSEISRGNHCAVLIENGKIVHHLYNSLSTVTSYGGMFRNTTVATYRHRLVKPDTSVSTVDIRDVLPPHVRRHLERRLAAAADAGS